MFQRPCSPHSRGTDSVKAATEPPNLTLSISGSRQESMLRCTHTHSLTHTLPRSLCPRGPPPSPPPPCSTNRKALGSTQNSRIPGFLEEPCTHVINQSDHIKALFTARPDGTIDPPPSLGGNTITWCIKLFFFVFSARHSGSHPQPTLDSFQTPTPPPSPPGLPHLLVISSVIQHLTHALTASPIPQAARTPTPCYSRRSCSDEAVTHTQTHRHTYTPTPPHTPLF